MLARERDLKEFHCDNVVNFLCGLVWASQGEPSLFKMTGTKHKITRKCILPSLLSTLHYNPLFACLLFMLGFEIAKNKKWYSG